MPIKMEKITDRYLILVVCVLLAAVTMVAYEQMRKNDFVNFDDGKYILKNKHVTTGLTADNASWAFKTGFCSNWHPLTWMSHMVDCDIFDVDPVGHHFVNLGFHIANTLLLFLILQQMTGKVWASAFVAGLFALHPVHVESVAWAAERKDLLSGFFWMVTMGAYVWYARGPGVGRYLLVVVAFCLGLLSKPMVVTLPFVLLLLDYWPLSRFSRKCVLEKVPLLGLSVVSCVITYMVQHGGGAVAVIHKWPLSIRVANAAVAYVRYIGKMLYPTKLSLLYPLPLDGLPRWQPIVCIALLVVVTAAVIYFGRRRRYLAVGWLWFLGTMVPVIGLVQVGMQAMADRYTYIPSIGFFIAIIWLGGEIVSKRRYAKHIAAVAMAAILVVLLVCTRMQVRHWENDLTLFGHSARVTTDNFLMHNKYGGALGDMGRLEESLWHCNEALRINPEFYKAHNNIGATYLKQERIAEAIPYLEKALKINPGFGEARNNLGVAYLKMGRLNDAIACFREVLRNDPNNIGAFNNLQIAHQQQQLLIRQIERSLGEYE